MTKTKIIFKILTIIGVFFLIAIGCISCKEKAKDILIIAIQNKTEDSIHITVYPKAEYLADSGGSYHVSDIGGGYTTTESSLCPTSDKFNWHAYKELFESQDLKIKPYTLAAKIFDSIYISTVSKDTVLIKFIHETVTGYSENIFSENSIWDFEIEETDEPDMGGKHLVNYHWYRFSILEDKFVKEAEQKKGEKR